MYKFFKFSDLLVFSAKISSSIVSLLLFCGSFKGTTTTFSAIGIRFRNIYSSFAKSIPFFVVVVVVVVFHLFTLKIKRKSFSTVSLFRFWPFVDLFSEKITHLLSDFIYKGINFSLVLHEHKHKQWSYYQILSQKEEIHLLRFQRCLSWGSDLWWGEVDVCISMKFIFMWIKFTWKQLNIGFKHATFIFIFIFPSRFVSQFFKTNSIIHWVC